VRPVVEVEADPQVGDVYYASWGYDQTNIDFYQVVARTPRTVRVRLINGKVNDEHRVEPVPGAFDTNTDWHGRVSSLEGKQCRLDTGDKPGRGIRIDDVRHVAWPYDGTPKYDTIAAGQPGH
jgi:hypothetical protein